MGCSSTKSSSVEAPPPKNKNNQANDDNGQGENFSLSEFQMRKIGHLFNCFDLDKDGFVSLTDFEILIKAFQDQREEKTDKEKIHKCLYEMWRNLLSESWPELENSISEKDWIEAWTKALQGVNTSDDYPFWIRRVSTSLFYLADAEDDGVIVEEEYDKFLEAFNLKNGQLNTSEIMNKLTKNGGAKMDKEYFTSLFETFLLGADEQHHSTILWGGLQPLTSNLASSNLI